MNYAILLAAGSGSRMELHDMPKAYIKVNDKPLFMYSLNTLLKLSIFDKIVLVVPKDYFEMTKSMVSSKNVFVVVGGQTRQESVYRGLDCLKAYAKEDDIVLTHDSARPLVSAKIILENIEAAKKYGAALTVIKAIDTIVQTNDMITVDHIPMRNMMLQEQTPATFKFSTLYSAHDNAIKFNIIDSSDDCSLVLLDGHKVYLVSGDRNNFKITNEIDLALFKIIVDKTDVFIN